MSQGEYILEQDNAATYFYSNQQGNAPVVRGNVVLAIALDRATSFAIDFVFQDGTKKQWVYLSKNERNLDLCNITSKLNATKH